MTYYKPKHVDLTPEALALGRERDLQASMTWPCKRYQGHHTTYVCKVRPVVVTS